MKEFKLSDLAKVVVHDDGSMEIFKALPEWPNNHPINIVLSFDEGKELTRLLQFDSEEMWTEEQKAKLRTAKPMYEIGSPDAEMVAKCPACLRVIRKWRLLQSPIGEIFCDVCKDEECAHCQMERQNCICVK